MPVTGAACCCSTPQPTFQIRQPVPYQACAIDTLDKCKRAGLFVDVSIRERIVRRCGHRCGDAVAVVVGKATWRSLLSHGRKCLVPWFVMSRALQMPEKEAVSLTH